MNIVWVMNATTRTNDMTYYTIKAAAQALADHLTLHELHAWSYEVHGSPRGFYVAVFDAEYHFLGTL